jgi:hypothetical protein
MGTTTDPNDPRLGHGVDKDPGPQQDAYLVLPDEDRAKGFVRPLRRSYKHVGPSGPTHALRDLSSDERDRYGHYGYVKFEKYPDGDSLVGRYWTQAQLDAVGKGCRVITKMSQDIAETYARNPKFYGSTYCCGCCKHLPIDEFVWIDDGSRVGS